MAKWGACAAAHNKLSIRNKRAASARRHHGAQSCAGVSNQASTFARKSVRHVEGINGGVCAWKKTADKRVNCSMASSVDWVARLRQKLVQCRLRGRRRFIAHVPAAASRCGVRQSPPPTIASPHGSSRSMERRYAVSAPTASALCP